MKVIFKGGPNDGETDEMEPRFTRRISYINRPGPIVESGIFEGKPDYEYVQTEEVDYEGRRIYRFKDNRE